MSRLDDIERRLAALEAGKGTGLEPRVAAVEEVLGMVGNSTAACTIDGLLDCKRCGNSQSAEAVNRCPQEKCPLK